MPKFEVNILGCGSATPSLRHMPSCQVLNIRDSLYMIDCGEGAQLAMRRMKLHFNRVRHIFISHLHGDHCFGLPGLLSTLALQQAGGEVVVHTSEDGVRIFSKILDYFCRERTYDLRFDVINGDSGVIVETDAITVETFPLYHRVPSIGFIFREKPKPRHINGDMVNFHEVPASQRGAIKLGADFVKPDGTVIANHLLTTDPDPSISYAYCSDTIFDPRVAESVKGVDVIYHEATYTDDKADKARDRFHSTASQAAQIALMAGAQTLIIGHYSKSYKTDEQHLAEARRIFPNTIAATEGMQIDLL